jgi:hypothetical protein
VWSQQGDLLSDVTAQGESKQIDLPEPERGDEADGVPGHVGDVVPDDARRASDSAQSDRDHLSISRQHIEQSGIPRVEVAPEMLQQDQRRRGSGAAEPAIHEGLSVNSNGQVRRGDGAFGVHGGCHSLVSARKLPTWATKSFACWKRKA